MQNRRTRARVPVISIARLTPQGVQSKQYVLVRDISTEGLGIYSQEKYQKGDLVLIELTLTHENEKINESIPGEVVWTQPLPDKVHYAVGIRIDSMELEKPKLYEQIKLIEESNKRDS
ncbi:MAG: PilZ domain-containing protein [Nitrospirae bacterium]|nr:PilZ domain-containing protein [Candidatus Manganitrophaceae bacterium]